MGAAWSIFVWVVVGSNPWGIGFLVFIFFIPFVYMSENTRYFKIGIVTTLSVGVIILRKYSVEEGDSIYELAYKRAIAITTAVVVVTIVNRLIWPYLARKELRKGMAMCLRNMGVYYRTIATDLLSLKGYLTAEATSIEQEIQFSILHLQGLLSFVSSEPRLRGPFPTEDYRTLLVSFQNLFDRLSALRLFVGRGFSKKVRKELVAPLNEQRKDMVTNALVTFHVLSGALYLKGRIPQHLPSAMVSRNRAAAIFRELPSVKKMKRPLDYMNFFAFVHGNKEMLQELQNVTRNTKKILGEDKFVLDST